MVKKRKDNLKRAALCIAGAICLCIVTDGCSKDGKQKETASSELIIADLNGTEDIETEENQADPIMENPAPVEEAEKTVESEMASETTETDEKEESGNNTEEQGDTLQKDTEHTNADTEIEALLGDTEAIEIAVPELVGMESSKAMEFLSSYYFNLSSVEYEYSDTVATGCIIKQEPAAGAGVEAGQEIKLVVSKGAESIKMPDVTGLLAEQAEDMLEALGMIVKNKAQKKDTAISYQSYAAGDSIKRNTEIVIK